MQNSLCATGGAIETIHSIVAAIVVVVVVVVVVVMSLQR